ncbi:hypothetical protein [Nocardioides sp. SYSU DS0651]|uniref:hypothetical protein n=1 Tax=Nocardioides sp. SYSU DS0651 TaxID=3415955 RepID=UPI003F4BCA51
MTVRLAAAAVLLLALAGCGSDAESPEDGQSAASPSTTGSATDDASSPAPSSSAPDTPTIPADAPRCGEVWSRGATLPGSYRGCVAGERYVKAEVLSCSSGQGIVRYDGRFWAVRGGTVSQADDIIEDERYLDAVARCRG